MFSNREKQKCEDHPAVKVIGTIAQKVKYNSQQRRAAKMLLGQLLDVDNVSEIHTLVQDFMVKWEMRSEDSFRS